MLLKRFDAWCSQLLECSVAHSTQNRVLIPNMGRDMDRKISTSKSFLCIKKSVNLNSTKKNSYTASSTEMLDVDGIFIVFLNFLIFLTTTTAQVKIQLNSKILKKCGGRY